MLSHALSPSHSSLYHGYQSPAPSDSWLPSLQLEVPEIPSKSPSIFPSATQSSSSFSSFSQEHLKLKKKSLSCSCCERRSDSIPKFRPRPWFQNLPSCFFQARSRRWRLWRCRYAPPLALQRLPSTFFIGVYNVRFFVYGNFQRFLLLLILGVDCLTCRLLCIVVSGLPFVDLFFVDWYVRWIIEAGVHFRDTYKVRNLDWCQS